MKTIKMMLYILTKKEKLGFILLFVGMFFNSFLEIFGLAILVPVVNIVAYPETAVANSWYLQLFMRILNIGNDDIRTLLIALVVFIAVVYVIKAVYLVLFNIVQQKFITRFSRRISTELFSNYLYQPYEFHVYHNTSELISRATYDAGQFVSGINLIMSTLSDILFFIVTFGYLLISEWMMTLIIFAVLGSAAVFLNSIFKKKALEYGRRAAIVNAKGHKAIMEGLFGIKETKIANREEFFIKSYDQTRKASQDLGIKQSVIGTIPRMSVETMGMLGMLIGLMVYYLIGNPPEKIVATFTLMALAVVKLLPYVTRITAQLNAFRGAMWSIHRVNEDLHLIRETPVEKRFVDKNLLAMAFEKQIVVQDVTFQYKSGIAPVLSHANAIIPKGKSVAFCGRSGAGKTTTVDILLGLLKPQDGHVLCDGVDILGDLNAWHKNLSYVPQDIYLIDDTIRANIAFGIDPEDIDDAQIWRSLEKAQLAEFVRALPDQINSKIGEKGVRLSGGQRQRIGIARALYRDTPILVLDEATSALDFETETDILKSVEGLRGEKTLIIITHRLGTIENCDYIYRIEDSAMACTKAPKA